MCLPLTPLVLGLFPSWLSGFISGLMVTLILVVWGTLKLYPAVSFSPSRRRVVPTSITVHEPPLPVKVWMNLLPNKCQLYNVDTYEVSINSVIFFLLGVGSDLQKKKFKKN